MKRFMFCAALFATGCGGGGSSAAVPTVSGGVGAPSSTAVPLPAQAVAEAQLLQGTLDVIRLVSPNEPVTPTVQSSTLLRAVMGNRYVAATVAPVGACQSGYEYGKMNGSKPQESIFTINSYYDDACTNVENVTTLDQIGGTAAFSQLRTADSYYTTGIQFAHKTEQMQATVDAAAQVVHATFQEAFASSAGAPALAAMNATCLDSASVSSCTAAYLEHTASIGADIGATLTLTDTSGSSTGTTLGIPDTVTGSLSLYGSTMNTLPLGTNSTTFPETLKVGTASISAMFNYSVPVHAQNYYAPTALTLTDSARDFTVQAAIQGNQLISTIVHTSVPGVPLASYTIDLYGNGTATFNDGVNAQRAIVNYFIQ